MNDDFDAIFGGRPTPKAKPTFTERFAPQPAAAASAAPAHEGATTSGVYKPYGFMPAGVGESCDVQRWLAGTDIAEGIEFQYRFLMQLGYVGEEQLKLFLPDCIVVIEGRHLRDLRKRLARRTVTFIQQFNPRVWTALATGEPVIDDIRILRPASREA